ncbi:MAG: hypothetical protein ACLQBC_10830 [Syntrophales bacterium]
MIIDYIVNMPCWYKVITIVFSLYYATRGVMYHFHIKTKYSDRTEYEIIFRVIIDYIQEVLFKVIITVSSFVALYVDYCILLKIESPSNIDAGTGIIIIFLFMWGVIGASGYLTHLITMGKVKV